MFKTVYLYGALRKFGDAIRVRASTPQQCVKALGVLFGHEFTQMIRANSFEVIRGKNKGDDSDFLNEERVGTGFIQDELHLIPAVQGSNNVWRIIAGIVLIIVGAYTENPYLIYAGIGLIVGGIAGMLTPLPNMSQGNGRQGVQSNLFGDVSNLTSQGGAVAVIYGRIVNCGSTVISRGISVAQVRS